MQYFGMAAANFPSVVVAKAGSGELDKGEMCVCPSHRVYLTESIEKLVVESHLPRKTVNILF